MSKAIALVTALVLGFAIFYSDAATPKAGAIDAPRLDFSAGRAMADIRAMGGEPHPVGSPANARVRDYLLARMRLLGLAPRIQRTSSFAVYGSDLTGATVENVIGVLRGRDPSAPALALMAHHDSVPGSPGAADDTAGVASALEIVRAIGVRGVPRRDVMLVITDGEEAGLLGARAFFDQDPLAAHVGYIINMETRGGGGRTAMFETAPANGADIALYRRTAAQPLSDALTVFVYRHMPNSTDFSVALRRGKVGLNYAFIGRQFDYHSPSSTPAALDEGALQHMGAQILPTAAALAFGPLPGRAPDVVYGNLIDGIVAAYPTGFGWVLLIASAALIVIGAWRAGRRGSLRGADLARGAGASVYIVALCGACLELARRATGVASGWTEYRPLLARFPVFEVMMLAAGLGGILAAAAFAGRRRSRWPSAALALVAGFAASAFGELDLAGMTLGGVGAVVGALTFGAPARAPGSWTGLMLMALAASLAVQILAPTAGALVGWPLLAAALAAALSATGADRGIVGLAAITLIAMLALSWLGGLFHQMLQGLDLPLLAAAPAWLAALVLWPLAVADDPEDAPLWPSAAMILVSLALASVIRFTDPWTARHPNAVEPLFIVDPAVHQAWRASLLPPDAWTLGVLKAEGGTLRRLRTPFQRHPVAAAAAAPVAAQPPMVTKTVGADGAVTLAAAFHPGAARLWLAIRSSGPITGVTVDGRPSDLNLAPGRWGRVDWAAPESFVIRFHARDAARIEVAAGELFDRWTATKPLPPIPPADQLWDVAGSTLVVGVATPGRTAP